MPHFHIRNLSLYQFRHQEQLGLYSSLLELKEPKYHFFYLHE